MKRVLNLHHSLLLNLLNNLQMELLSKFCLILILHRNQCFCLRFLHEHQLCNHLILTILEKCHQAQLLPTIWLSRLYLLQYNCRLLHMHYGFLFAHMVMINYIKFYQFLLEFFVLKFVIIILLLLQDIQRDRDIQFQTNQSKF